MTSAAPQTLGLDEMVTATVRHLQDRFPDATISQLTSQACLDDAVRTPADPAEIRVVSPHPAGAGDTAPGLVVISGTAAGSRGSIVAAAVDDDANAGPILCYAAEQARRLGVPLRVVHVWTGQAVPGWGAAAGHDPLCSVDLLLSGALYDHLPAADAEVTEREILHDPDVVDALLRLSATAALLVTAARSAPSSRHAALGGTVRGLLGRTACPLAVVGAEGTDADVACIW
jgi:nucleotide-binding universal stress UspA family protein